jgi:8-oxo-dGTP diphosphatase
MSITRQNPVTAVADTVLLTIIDGKLQVLCVTRQRDPFDGQKTLPGTYIRSGESSRVAALRALKDKAGVKDVYIEQLYTFDELGRDPRGQYLSVVYLCTVHIDDIHLNISEETQNPEFIDVTTALAFDHSKIVKYALDRLRSKLEYTSIAQTFLPVEFTLSELQRVYEIILGHDLDKRNFRKKIISTDLIEVTGNMQSGRRQRPAQLYRFVSDKVVEIPRWI